MSDGSVGVESVIHTPSAYNPSSIAGEVAEDMTGELVDQLLEMTAQEQGGTSSAAETAEDISSLKGLVQQLQSELSNTKSELEFAKAENSNLQKNSEEQQRSSDEAISSLQQQVNALVDNSKDQKKEKDSMSSSRKQLELDHAETKAELERVKAKGSANEALENQYKEVVAQNAALQGKLKATNEELDSALRQAEAARALQSQIPEGDQQAALHLANQQVAQFNTQMAHLYAQLTCSPSPSDVKDSYFIFMAIRIFAKTVTVVASPTASAAERKKEVTSSANCPETCQQRAAARARGMTTPNPRMSRPHPAGIREKFSKDCRPSFLASSLTMPLRSTAMTTAPTMRKMTKLAQVGASV